MRKSSKPKATSRPGKANLIVLQPRDPWWIHAYWELTPDAGAQRILRIYEEETSRSFDIPLIPGANDWAIQVRPDQAWVVEIGSRGTHGRFTALARSNSVRTPPDRPSDRIDEDWRVIESMPAGWPPGPSSGERPA